MTFDEEKQAVDELEVRIKEMIREARFREVWQAMVASGIGVGATILGMANLACHLGWVCVFWVA